MRYARNSWKILRSEWRNAQNQMLSESIDRPHHDVVTVRALAAAVERGAYAGFCLRHATKVAKTFECNFLPKRPVHHRSGMFIREEPQDFSFLPQEV